MVGFVFFYNSSISVREVQLSEYTTFEFIAVYMSGSRRHALVLVVYRPGTAAAPIKFFDEFADLLERISLFSCPLLILGDINIHLDIADDDNTVAFMSLLDQHSLTQHIAAATHRGGHTLDIVVTRSDRPITTLDIGRPRIFSDHSFITAEIDLQFQHGQAVQEIRRRHWRRMNFDQLCDDIACSDLLVDPPSDAVGLFTCYNETLQALIDKHAPYGAVKVRAHSNAPCMVRL